MGQTNMKYLVAFLIIILSTVCYSASIMTVGGGSLTYTTDSYWDAGTGSMDVYATYSMYSQSFTSGGGILDSVQWKLMKSGSPTGNATARIYAHSGSYGTTSKPTGSVLAESGTLDVSTLDGTLTWKTFTFTGANRIVLSAGYYCVIIYYAGGNSSNKIKVGYDNGAGGHSGVEAYFDTGWTNEAVDLNHYVYVYR